MIAQYPIFLSNFQKVCNRFFTSNKITLRADDTQGPIDPFEFQLNQHNSSEIKWKVLLHLLEEEKGYFASTPDSHPTATNKKPYDFS